MIHINNYSSCYAILIKQNFILNYLTNNFNFKKKGLPLRGLAMAAKKENGCCEFLYLQPMEELNIKKAEGRALGWGLDRVSNA